jgi:hypothetical protein
VRSRDKDINVNFIPNAQSVNTEKKVSKAQQYTWRGTAEHIKRRTETKRELQEQSEMKHLFF